MGLVEWPFKAAMPAFLRAFFVTQAYLPDEHRPRL
jgi:hypothetical protein